MSAPPGPDGIKRPKGNHWCPICQRLTWHWPDDGACCLCHRITPPPRDPPTGHGAGAFIDRSQPQGGA